MRLDPLRAEAGGDDRRRLRDRMLDLNRGLSPKRLAGACDARERSIWMFPQDSTEAVKMYLRSKRRTGKRRIGATIAASV